MFLRITRGARRSLESIFLASKATMSASPPPVAGDDMQTSQITSPKDVFSLENILGQDHESLEHPGLNGQVGTGWDEEVKETTAAEGYCIECEGKSFVCLPSGSIC